MPPPTMLVPGKVVAKPHHTAEERAKIARMTPKDYTIDWFKQRSGSNPMIKITGPGDRVMVLRSGTGSGKSTTMGPELYLYFYMGRSGTAATKNIAVTQPRVLTSTDIPLDVVAAYSSKGIKLGENIGYQTGQFTFKPPRGIIFMTIGVLTQQLKVMSDEEFMATYGHVIIDECHDRSLEMDLALALMKKLIQRNYKSRDCPFLIVTSATFDVDKYARYFDVDPREVIDVQGLNFPIKMVWPPTPVGNYIEYSIGIILNIHRKNVDDYIGGNRFTDILMFAHGVMPIRDMKQVLEAENENEAHISTDNYYVIISLTREAYQTKSIDFQNIFKPLSAIQVVLKNGRIVTPNRRVILSTNIAETGVTIDTLKYVLDAGYANVSMFNPVYGSYSLFPQPVAKDNARQRWGRVGRRAPGECYPLYTEAIYAAMRDNPYPDILTTNITSLILGLAVKAAYPKWDGTLETAKKIDADLVESARPRLDPDNLDMLDAPAADGLAYALERLYCLGMINSQLRPTQIGLLASHMQKLDVECTRMILAGFTDKFISSDARIIDLVTIAAFVSSQVGGKSGYKNTKPGGPSFRPMLLGPNVSNERNALFNQLWIGCDFIETLWAWQEFCDVLAGADSKDDSKDDSKEESKGGAMAVSRVRNYCESRGLIYDGILNAIQVRDEILQALTEKMGLPWRPPSQHNHKSIPELFAHDPARGAAAVRAIKQCIYEGFRLNSASWDLDSSSYVLDSVHERIVVDSAYVKPIIVNESPRRPLKILVRQVAYKKPMRGPLYRFSADMVCLIDGLDYDETFSIS